MKSYCLWMWNVLWMLLDLRGKAKSHHAPRSPLVASYPLLCQLLLWNSHPQDQCFTARILCLCSHTCRSSRVLLTYTGLLGHGSASHSRPVGPGLPALLTPEPKLKGEPLSAGSSSSSKGRDWDGECEPPAAQNRDVATSANMPPAKANHSF